MKKLLGISTFLLLCISIIFSPGSADALDITLRWDANSEPDLAGYKIYYKTGTPGGPYDGTGALQGPSPIDIPLDTIGFDPDNPEFTINDLSDSGRYFLVVTAYDDELPENESGFSNEVTNKHKLTLQTSGNGSIESSPIIPGDGLYGLDQTVSLTGVPDPGWLFGGWSGDHTGAEAMVDIVMDHDKTITATFTETPVQTYLLTVNTEGRGAVSPAGGEYVAGTVVSVTATAAPGWEFKEWLNVDGNPIGNSPVIDITMDEPIEITAVFENTPLAPPGGLSIISIVE